MSAQHTVFAFLHGRSAEKFSGSFGSCDEGLYAFSFRTHAEDYTAYVRKITFSDAHLVLFDGYLLPHGMPDGGGTLDYEYGRHEDKFSQFAQKIITWQVDRSAACGLAYQEIPSANLFERSLGNHEHLLRATLTRQLLIIPKGKTAFGFRLNSPDLKRQYVMIDAGESHVQFHTTAR